MSSLGSPPPELGLLDGAAEPEAAPSGGNGASLHDRVQHILKRQRLSRVAEGAPDAVLARLCEIIEAQQQEIAMLRGPHDANASIALNYPASLAAPPVPSPPSASGDAPTAAAPVASDCSAAAGGESVEKGEAGLASGLETLTAAAADASRVTDSNRPSSSGSSRSGSPPSSWPQQQQDQQPQPPPQDQQPLQPPPPLLLQQQQMQAQMQQQQGVRACLSCGTTETPKWRCGMTLCNACGLRQAKTTGAPRRFSHAETIAHAGEEDAAREAAAEAGAGAGAHLQSRSPAARRSRQPFQRATLTREQAHARISPALQQWGGAMIGAYLPHTPSAPNYPMMPNPMMPMMPGMTPFPPMGAFPYLPYQPGMQPSMQPGMQLAPPPGFAGAPPMQLGAMGPAGVMQRQALPPAGAMGPAVAMQGPPPPLAAMGLAPAPAATPLATPAPPPTPAAALDLACPEATAARVEVPGFSGGAGPLPEPADCASPIVLV